MRKLLFIAALAAGAALALSGTASADLLNYYDFQDTLADTAGLYVGSSSTSNTDLSPFDINSNPATAGYVPGMVGQATNLRYNVGPGNTRLMWSQDGDPDNALGDDFTVMTWLNIGQVGGAKWGRFYIGANWDTTLQFEQTESNGTIPWDVGGEKAISPAQSYSYGTWMHVAGVADSAAGKVYLYFNGGVVGDGGFVVEAAYDGTGSTSTGGFGIGGAANGPNNQYETRNTWVDEFSMWDEALSAATILAHYEAGLRGESLLEVIPIPEPAGLGLLGVALLAMRKRR